MPERRFLPVAVRKGVCGVVAVHRPAIVAVEPGTEGAPGEEVGQGFAHGPHYIRTATGRERRRGVRTVVRGSVR